MLRSSSRVPANGGSVRPSARASAGGGGGADFEDKYRRTAEENLQLKKERNELEEKLKELKTKFRRLTRDLVPDENGDYVLGGAGPNVGRGAAALNTSTASGGANVSVSGAGGGVRAASASRMNASARMGAAASKSTLVNGGGGGAAAGSASFHQPSHIGPSFGAIQSNLFEQEKRRLEDNLKRAKAQIDYMQAEMSRQRSTAPQSEQDATHLANQIQLLHQQLDNARSGKVADDHRLGELQRERDVVHSNLAAMRAQLDASESNRTQIQQQLTDALAALATANHQLRTQGTQNVAGAVAGAAGGAGGFAPVDLGADYHKRQVQELMAQLQTMRDKQLEDQHAIEVLTRERDATKLQLGRAQAAAIGAGVGGVSGGNLNGSELYAGQLPASATAVDSHSLHELQRALSEKSAQILVLTRQMEFAKSQAEVAKVESERFLEDIKSLHLQHAEVKRNMFTLEHEKASLLLRCEKVSTLEATLELKTQELMRSEHELLKLIDRLQSCSRDTEAQVRRELGDRMAELENMRDKAEADRRSNEREVLAVRLEVNDFKRRLDNALHDTELYKRETQRLEAEKKEMMDRVAMANVSGLGGLGASMSAGGGASGADMDDDVHRAIALATMRKRAAGGANALSLGGAGASSTSMGLNGLVGGSSGGGGTANEVMAMWEGMEWSDGKELSMLRETLAATAVDMELAETRCTQLQQAVNDKVALLTGVSSERDELLEENIELRHRISGVQTALARAQLLKVAKAQSNQAGKTSLIIALNSIACDPVFQQRDDGSMYTPTLFFSLELEGIDGYEPVLSETFYSLNSTLSVQFVFDNIDTTEINFAKLQKTNFVLQLHQSFGTESDIVASATLNGSRLLHCRYDGVHDDKLPLFSLEGENMGSVDVTVTAPDLLIPILMARPIISAVTSDTIRASLIAFRSVRALRIQVFAAHDLACSSRNDGSLPSPYVYYTSTSPHGITFIGETMVSTSSRMLTVNPTFDLVPVDHPVVLDAEFVRFMNDGALSFVVFDHKASDIQSNLGIAVVPLNEMLRSPTHVIQTKLPLHPQGHIEVGISWLRGAE